MTILLRPSLRLRRSLGYADTGTVREHGASLSQGRPQQAVASPEAPGGARPSEAMAGLAKWGQQREASQTQAK